MKEILPVATLVIFMASGQGFLDSYPREVKPESPSQLYSRDL